MLLSFHPRPDLTWQPSLALSGQQEELWLTKSLVQEQSVHVNVM